MKYNWKILVPREGTFNLSFEGYLQEPGEYLAFNPDLVTLKKYLNLLLILLGEPGIGKSNTMQKEEKSIDSKNQEKGDQALWIDFRSYGSEDN